MPIGWLLAAARRLLEFRSTAKAAAQVNHGLSEKFVCTPLDFDEPIPLVGRVELPMKVSELISLLELEGWFQVRMKGSHRQFHHKTRPGTVTVAGKLSLEVPRGTLNSCLKQAGLKG